jgi:hypothetical protein
LDVARSYRKQPVRLHEHFYGRDKMKEEGHAAEVDTPPARTLR